MAQSQVCLAINKVWQWGAILRDAIIRNFFYYLIQLNFIITHCLNPLSSSPTKWLNTLKQFVGKLPTDCLSVFGHFVKLALKGLRYSKYWHSRIQTKKRLYSSYQPHVIPGDCDTLRRFYKKLHLGQVIQELTK